MPLIQSKSDKAFSKNVSSEMDSGSPQKQALAIAYAIKRRNKFKGGLIKTEDGLEEAKDYELDREENDMAHGGEVGEYSGGGSIMHPKNMAQMILQKRAMGGMIDSEEALNKAQAYELAKEEHPEGPMDNETMPVDSEGMHDDMFSPESDEGEEFNPRKNILDRILGGIKIRHRMG